MPMTAQRLREAMENHKAGNLDAAEAIYRDVLAGDPKNADALHMLGVLVSQRGDQQQALSLLGRAVRLNPTPPFYHNNLGNVLFQAGRFADAKLCYEEALRLDPDYAEAHGNLANTCRRLGLLENELAHRLEVVRLRPERSGSYAELGNTLRAQGMIAEALVCFEQALAIAPEDAEAHIGRAFALLLVGDLAAGWREYEWRWKTGRYPVRAFAAPLWDGSPLDGRTVLIYAEPDLNQTLQFARYLPLAAERGGKVVFECRPQLAPLMRGTPGVAEVVEAGSPLPAFDVQAPLGSLPLIFNTRPDRVPAAVPYLGVGPRKAKRTRQTRTVGLAWTGDRAVLEPLLDVPGISFVNLEKTENLAGTAEAMSELDLVISGDDTLTHLAGALAMPVWNLTPYAPDWPWMLGRDNSPWYPTMRLFRQMRPGDWSEVVSRVREVLMS
ncbi:MAG: tetratricopeptide repeat protein [Rhodospirillales bacterium]